MHVSSSPSSFDDTHVSKKTRVICIKMTLQDKDFYLKIILRLSLYADVTNAKVARSGDST